MANQRMYLVHVPSRLGVALGKRMGWGWYQHAGNEASLGGRVQALFEKVAEAGWDYDGDQDDFRVVLEINDEGIRVLPGGALRARRRAATGRIPGRRGGVARWP